MAMMTVRLMMQTMTTEIMMATTMAMAEKAAMTAQGMTGMVERVAMMAQAMTDMAERAVMTARVMTAATVPITTDHLFKATVG